MIELLGLPLATLGSLFRSRNRLILENLLLRQQLQVPLRHQHRPRLRTWDKLFWLLCMMVRKPPATTKGCTGDATRIIGR